ncbi:MAG: uroporphyrinogen-III C-methyltransferase [Acidobacteria bacterium]|nr:uroporphyrinogen-III C-methyltransferase [Acidobacteriota bacterium]
MTSRAHRRGAVRPAGRERRGFVSLVGAGPGSPDLLTYRAIQRLQDADVVFYDGLVPRAMLALAADAEHISVARRAGSATLSQEDVNVQLIERARRGQRVVRLKSGDPFVLGRGGEEVLALSSAGVSFDVVPGVSSAIAAPALAGIPVTHRGMSSGFVVVSGHAASAYEPLLGSLAPESATVVVLMGLGRRRAIGETLRRAGWAGATPTAIVRNASRPDQHVWCGTLDALGVGDAGADEAADDDPGVIVIGQVVSLATAPDLARSFAPEETVWQPSTTPRR